MCMWVLYQKLDWFFTFFTGRVELHSLSIHQVLWSFSCWELHNLFCVVGGMEWGRKSRTCLLVFLNHMSTVMHLEGIQWIICEPNSIVCNVLRVSHRPSSLTVPRMAQGCVTWRGPHALCFLRLGAGVWVYWATPAVSSLNLCLLSTSAIVILHTCPQFRVDISY